MQITECNMDENDYLFYRDENKIIAPIGFVLIGSLIRNSTVIMTILSDSLKNAIAIGVKGMIFLSLILALQVIVNRVSRNFWILSLFGAICAGFHMIIFPDNNPVFIKTCISFVTTLYPCMLCLKSIGDYEYFFEKIVIYSKVALAINVLVFFVFMGGAFSGTVNMGYSMSFILPLNLVIASLLYKKQDKKILNLCLIAFSVMSILIFGSRGSLVSIVICVLSFLILSDNQMNTKNRIAFLLLLTVIIVIALLFFKPIMSVAVSIFDKMGVSSRSLNMLLENDFFYNNGRNLIWNQISDRIRENPFAIRGINADQLLVTGYYQGSNTSHNVILEMCYSFGIIFGPIICLLLLCKIIKCFHIIRNSHDVLKLVFLFSFFPICLWSGSLWESAWWYWICL